MKHTTNCTNYPNTPTAAERLHRAAETLTTAAILTAAAIVILAAAMLH